MAINMEHLLVYLGMLFGGAVVYAVSVTVYRIFFHPLAKYPGPLLAKVSDVYQLYYAYIGDRHLNFYDLHQRYGPVVRFGPNCLSFNSNTALKDIYGFRANVRKSEFYDAFAHPAPNTHNSRDKEMHARKRRVLSHAFSDSATREMQRYILNNVRNFCEQVGAQQTYGDEKSGAKGGWTVPKNMSDLTAWLAMDVLGDLSFGKAFSLLEKPDNRFAVGLVEAATTRHLICGTMPIIDKLKLDTWIFPKLAAQRAKFMKYSRGQLVERTELGEDADRRDFFHYLLKARDPETGLGFSTPELWGESNLLLIAGSDTTATAMAATFFYLTRPGHEPMLEKVTAEIRSKFTDVEEIVHGAALSSCTYLRACIDEAMRMSPSVGGIPPREVLPGGITIDGRTIPEGTVVGVPHYAIQHNEAYHPTPYRYIPERWIEGATSPYWKNGTEPVTAEDVALAGSAYCPFSIGPRGCIGKNLAYVEMTLTLARTMWLYDMKAAEGVPDPAEGCAAYGRLRDRKGEMQLWDTFTSAKKGVMLSYKPAKH